MDIEAHINTLIEPFHPNRISTDRLGMLLSILDLTTLEGTDHSGTIQRLCDKAKSYSDLGLPSPAAVCVYSPFIRQAKKQLIGTSIHVAAVTSFFPSGQAPLHLKLEEVKYAVGEGADELDMVISRGKLLEGDDNFVFDEIAAIKALSGNAHLKVILETGELKTPELIRKASLLAIQAGGDCIKTSTGKIQPAATEEAAYLMLHVIKEHHAKTGQKIGFKPAGGISEPMQAWRYSALVEAILGPEWLDKERFRIGASRLADRLQEALLGNTAR